jgi:hypothetical protein
VPAGELRLGDAVRGPLGEILHVVSTRYEEHPSGIAVYNLEVESLHTYYIASPHARAPPALVHNRNVCTVERVMRHRGRKVETLARAPISGLTRAAHRRAANRELVTLLKADPAANARLCQWLGVKDVLKHMTAGGRLRNPPGTEWHHPKHNASVMDLLRREVHRDSELQSILHPGGLGGYAHNYQ